MSNIDSLELFIVVGVSSSFSVFCILFIIYACIKCCKNDDPTEPIILQLQINPMIKDKSNNCDDDPV
jgi:hypothetical protein